MGDTKVSTMSRENLMECVMKGYYAPIKKMTGENLKFLISNSSPSYSIELLKTAVSLDRPEILRWLCGMCDFSNILSHADYIIILEAASKNLAYQHSAMAYEFLKLVDPQIDCLIENAIHANNMNVLNIICTYDEYEKK